MKRLLLALLLAALSAAALEPRPRAAGERLVTDPAATGGEALAILVGEPPHAHAWPLAERPLPPGRYRLTLRARLWLPAGFDVARVRLDWRTGDTSRTLLWPHFNSAPDTYTTLEREFDLALPAAPVAGLDFALAALPAGVKEKPLQTSRPVLGETATAGDPLLDAVLAEAAIPLAELPGAALLVDSFTLAPVTTGLAVAKVWPAKVHVYPGEANPITVTVRNFAGQPATATLRLTLRTGLDEVAWQAEQPVALAGGATAELAFAWSGSDRAFGYEARAELLDGATVRRAASEYFSVSTPIWQTAIQGSGFITWYGREEQFAEHVAANRRAYINVEEAFSWQPSSWDDLTPAGDAWWTGQNNFHNSRRGLELWRELTRREGIKLITYLWATASGPAGAETARRFPETIARQPVGLASEFHDVEDLRLYAATHDRPPLWRHHYGVWHSFSFNRGQLQTMQLAIDEVIASAREFGWDGARFDSPPEWGAMAAAPMHADFARLGVADLMARLLPEYYAQRDGQWSAEAVSVRNIRYARECWRQALGPHFAVGNNLEVTGAEDLTPFSRACAAAGGQLMNESIRQSRSWAAYRAAVLSQTAAARAAGGHSTVVALNEVSPLAASYAAIYTFAGGSHPYLSYGLQPTGTYNQFATRFGEFLWHPDWQPLAAADSSLTIADETLLWQPFLRRRTLPNGARQTALHLISPLADDRIQPPAAPLPPPWRPVTVRVPAAASVWLLSAEPATRAAPLPVAADGTVTIPEHRHWSLLLITEATP
jgi:hypothetical protein